MRTFSKVVSVVILGIAVAGCLESDEWYVLNPNGSGKVFIKAVFSPPPTLGGKQSNPDELMKNIVSGILEKSKGVDAWRNVDFAMTKAGKISFGATAYFPNITKLDFQNLGTFHAKFARNASGDYVLELVEKERAGKPPAATLSQAEIKQKARAEKTKYQQAKPMMTALMSQLKCKATFKLPGKVKTVSNFEQVGEDKVRIAIEGDKLLAAMDELAKDDNYWRKQVLAGGTGPGGNLQTDLELNEKLFGRKAPIRAVVIGPTKPLFKYADQVAAAKKAYPAMMMRLGLIAKSIPSAGSALEGFQVAAVNIVTVSSKEFNLQPMYKITLIGPLPENAAGVSAGELKKAVTDTGQSLIPKKQWERKIHFLKLSDDKTSVKFDINLLSPSSDVRGLKQLSGKLSYLMATTSSTVDLGLASLRAGAKGTEFDARIKSIGKDKWMPDSDRQTLALEMKIDKDRVKSVNIYDSAGKKLDVRRSGSQWGGQTIILNYSIKGRFPSKGGIKIEVYDNLKKIDAPFKLKDVNLLGRPM